VEARRGRRDAGSTDAVADRAGADADPEAVAKSICLRLLTASPRTRAQLADALSKRNVPADAAERALDRLTEVGLIDDTAFAHAWVRSRQNGRGLARRALASELRARGVDEEVARSALDTIDAADELTAAQELVRRRLPALRGQPYAVQARRLSGVLARKGYSGDVVMRVVREALDASAGDSSDADKADSYSSDLSSSDFEALG
jgi:regulatory protein